LAPERDSPLSVSRRKEASIPNPVRAKNTKGRHYSEQTDHYSTVFRERKLSVVYGNNRQEHSDSETCNYTASNKHANVDGGSLNYCADDDWTFVSRRTFLAAAFRKVLIPAAADIDRFLPKRSPVQPEKRPPMLFQQCRSKQPRLSAERLLASSFNLPGTGYRADLSELHSQSCF